jgi:hypothetical protein
MNDYEKKMSMIYDLGGTPKQLTEEAILHLKAQAECFMDDYNTNEMEKVLPYIITYTYNQAYVAAINDVLMILHSRS